METNKDITFIVHSEWLECIAGLPIEQQDKIIADFVRYGCEIAEGHSGDAITQAFVNMLKGRIDYSKNQYAQKVEQGASGGRPRKVDDSKVYQLARQGRTAQEIADIFGCKKTTIDHNIGWKNRNKEDFLL